MHFWSEGEKSQHGCISQIVVPSDQFSCHLQAFSEEHTLEIRKHETDAEFLRMFLLLSTDQWVTDPFEDLEEGCRFGQHAKQQAAKGMSLPLMAN